MISNVRGIFRLEKAGLENLFGVIEIKDCVNNKKPKRYALV